MAVQNADDLNAILFDAIEDDVGHDRKRSNVLAELQSNASGFWRSQNRAADRSGDSLDQGIGDGDFSAGSMVEPDVIEVFAGTRRVL
jgi:hypothetical protein